MSAIEFHPIYHPAQNEIFYGNSAKLKVVPKGRRLGLTQGYSTYVIENLLAGIESILWVDTVQGNIDRYFQRYFMPQLNGYIRDNDGNWVRSKWGGINQKHWRWDPKKKEFHLLNGFCDFRSAERPDLIEGFAYRLILLNEAGIILRNRYLWDNAIQPMRLDFNPDVIVGGTPKGGGLFEEMAANAKGEPDQWTKTYSTYDNPYLSRELIDKMARDYPEQARKQEIYGEFISDKGAVFRRLPEALDHNLKPLPHWEPKRKYYMGVDLAKQIDWTVIIILDDAGNMVYFNRFNKLDWEYQQRVIIEAAKLFRARVLIDSTGIGDPIFDALKSKGLTLEGYKINTSEAKKRLIEGLMLAFEMQKVKIFAQPVDGADILYDELRLFGYEISASGTLRYEAPEGFHDDCVIALALAWMCKENMKPKGGFVIADHHLY